PDVPCGLKTDSERARHVRSRLRQMRNSRGEWEPVPAWREVPAGEVFVYRQTAAALRTPGPDRKESDARPPDPGRGGERNAASFDGEPSEDVTVGEPGETGVPPGHPGEGTSESPVWPEPAAELVPVLTVQKALEKLGQGWLVGLQDTPQGRIYGRGVKVADVMTG